MNDSGAIAFLNFLASKFPPLKEVFDDHVEEFGGEVIPHLLLARFGDWAFDANEQNNTSLRDFVLELDHGFEVGDEYTRNMILVSFLEHIPSDSSLVERLGPLLRREAGYQ